MNDFLFGNNNKQIIKKLSARNFLQNIKQNKVMIVSIALVTFMIFIIFSVGMSFYQNYSDMSLRVTGTKANGLLTALSKEQIDDLQQLDYISTTGEQIFSGYHEIDSGETIVFTSYDTSEWEHHIKDTVDNITGTLPQAEDELMLSNDAMSALGIKDPTLGMDIPITLESNGQEYSVVFKLCGWYHDYMAVSRPVGSYSGNVAAAGLAGARADWNAIVSPSFAKQHSVYQLTTFISGDTSIELEKNLKADLNLNDTQSVIIISFQSGNSISGLYTVIGVLLGGIFIMLCGYLLIYNIAYISVSKDIHFYGMLKTLGTTSKQLKKIVRRQILLLSCIAIPSGLVLGSIVSLFAVPMILNTMLSSGGLGDAMSVKTTFNLLIYVGTALFSFFTVTLSCYKPAREAGKVSPIVAIRYTGVTANVNKLFGTHHKNKTGLGPMAYRNVFRDRKKAVLVFLSLFMGLTVFLFIFTAFSNPNWEYSAIVDAPYDFTLGNASIRNDDKGSFFNEQLLEQINSVEGIIEKEIVYGVAAELSLSDSSWNPYIEDKLQVSAVEEADLKSGLRADTAGISAKLLQTLPLANGVYDTQALTNFELGKTVYLSSTENEQVPEGIVGQTIQIKDPATKQTASYTIAGILKPLTLKDRKEGENFTSNIGTIRDNQLISAYGQHRIVKIYMSESGIRKVAPVPIVNEILINVDPAKESTVKQQLIDLQDGNSAMYLLAQSTYIESNKMTLGSLMIIGTIFSFLLLLIGLMNFINTIATTIYSRQLELATLESIGMSKKQLYKMLSYEGSIYASFSALLLLLVGIPFTYGFITLIREQFYFLTFQPPVAAILLIIVLVFCICWFVPRFTFKRVSEKSVIERLRVE